jgi:short-subunit dehydrogenase
LDSRQYGPWALIAGGSEGVGASFALKLAAHGINLVLVARKTAPLEEVAEQVGRQSSVSVRTLSMDLCSDDMFARITRATNDIEIGMLIYNAGSERTFEAFHDRDLANAERMIALNISGVTRLAHYYGGHMRERRRGGIILVGSTAGYAGGGKVVMYAASKAFDCIFAEGLWYELRPHNVHVLGLILGATRTPQAVRLGMNFDSSDFPAADPDVVAQEGLEHLGIDPVWHSGGTEPIAQGFRTMKRADAIAAMSMGNESMGVRPSGDG